MTFREEMGALRLFCLRSSRHFRSEERLSETEPHIACHGES